MNRSVRRQNRKEAMCATLFKVKRELPRYDSTSDQWKKLFATKMYLSDKLAKINYTEIYAKDDHEYLQQMMELVNKLQGDSVDVYRLKYFIEMEAFRARFRAMATSKDRWRA